MILTIEKVGIAFGTKRVLDGLSFSMTAGETVALMGPNGAGKTTLLRCVLGLLRYEGRILVEGFDARRQGVAARERMAYVPQVPAFYDMTAREVVHFVARLRRIPIGKGDEALERLGLGGDADRPVRVYSGGMQQRLSLAAALVGDPPLVLLDEPTANLDPAARASILELLVDFKKAGKTLLLSSHRAHEVRGLATRVIFIREGRVAKDGRPSEVLPPDRLALSVEAHGAEEKARIGAMLAGIRPLPTFNGTWEGLVESDRAAEVVETLLQGGVERSRISLRPLDDGGVA